MKDEIITLTANLFSDGSFRPDKPLTNERAPPSRQDQVFYRKRIVAILNAMLKGKRSCSRLKELHDDYVAGVIAYIQEQDRREEIQSRYNEDSQSVSMKTKQRRQAPSSIGASRVLRRSADINSMRETRQSKEADIRKFVTLMNPPQTITFPRTKTIDIKKPRNRSKSTRLDSNDDTSIA